MRQLIGRLPSKERGAVDEIYLAEHVRCRECQRTSPMGIELVTVQKAGTTKKILRRAFFAGPMARNIKGARRATLSPCHVYQSGAA
jgi:hypothetical protein